MRKIFDKLASFFRPKPSATEVALNLIPPVIELQLTLASGKNSPEHLRNDNYALGYIFGYHDGILQALKVDDQSTIIAIMAVSYDTIFGGQTVAAQLLRKSLDAQGDATFRQGGWRLLLTCVWSLKTVLTQMVLLCFWYRSRIG